MSRLLRDCPHCGCELVKPRSPKHHKMFFAFIDDACENWPLDHPDFQPMNSEQLRAWLLCQTVHSARIGNMLEVANPSLEKMIDFFGMAMHAVKVHGFGQPVVTETGHLELVVPKSIAWAELDEKEFRPIAEEIYALIEDHTGLKIKEWKKTKWTRMMSTQRKPSSPLSKNSGAAKPHPVS